MAVPGGHKLKFSVGLYCTSLLPQKICGSLRSKGDTKAFAEVEALPACCLVANQLQSVHCESHLGVWASYISGLMVLVGENSPEELASIRNGRLICWHPLVSEASPPAAVWLKKSYSLNTRLC